MVELSAKEAIVSVGQAKAKICYDLLPDVHKVLSARLSIIVTVFNIKVLEVGYGSHTVNEQVLILQEGDQVILALDIMLHEGVLKGAPVVEDHWGPEEDLRRL